MVRGIPNPAVWRIHLLKMITPELRAIHELSTRQNGTLHNPQKLHHLLRDIDSWMQSRGGFGSSGGGALVGGWKFGRFVRHDEFSIGPQTTKKEGKKKDRSESKRRLWQPDEDKVQTSD